MLIAKGYSPSFKMVAGGTIRSPHGAALLHDPSGRIWPACSGLVISFQKGGGPLEDKTAKEYLGVGPLKGSAIVPPRALNGWRLLGDIAVVNYRRIGKHAAGYFHPIEGGRARLYRRGRALRMELGKGCVWNWRGIVTP
jgi:hypothetical protein